MTGWRKKQIAESVEEDIIKDVKDWTYRWNDRVVTFEEYQRLTDEHTILVTEMEKMQELENKSSRKTKLKGKA
jgi:hypothetical protein